MKNNIEYYPHEKGSHLNGKFKMLRLKYGWEGEGRFWALNNIMADSEGCILDLNKKYVKADVVETLGFSITEFDEYIKYLVEECELIYFSEEGKITNKTLQERFEICMKEREKARIRKAKKDNKKEGSDEILESSGELTDGSGEKLTKESKVKERKENNKAVAEERARESEIKQSEIKQGQPEETDSEKLKKIYAHYFSKPPNLGDIQIIENFLKEFDLQKVEAAFRRARENLNDKINLGYVRGILYETGIKKEEAKRNGPNSENKSSAKSRMEYRFDPDKFRKRGEMLKAIEFGGN